MERSRFCRWIGTFLAAGPCRACGAGPAGTCKISPEVFRRIRLKWRNFTMTKTELISAVALKAELTKKDSEKAVAAVFDTITEALVAGDSVSLVGFGKFEEPEREDGYQPPHQGADEDRRFQAAVFPRRQGPQGRRRQVKKLFFHRAEGVPCPIFLSTEGGDPICGWTSISSSPG